MPMRAMKYCTVAGCVNLTRKGRCDTCARAREQTRGSAAQRGYNDREHNAWREDVMAKSDGMCVACMAVGIVTVGRVADHIVPRSAGGAPHDVSNGQALCDGQTGRGCHDRKRAAERQGRQLMVQQGKGLVDVGPLRRVA